LKSFELKRHFVDQICCRVYFNQDHRRIQVFRFVEILKKEIGLHILMILMPIQSYIERRIQGVSVYWYSI